MGWDGVERRKYARADIRCRLNVVYLNKSFAATSDNISAGGIKVTLDEQLSVGEVVQLDITPPATKTIRCSGRIVWVLPKHDEASPLRLFNTGIQFEDIAQEDRNIIFDAVERFLKKDTTK